MGSWRQFTPDSSELAGILYPTRTAVLIVDVQNDFGHVNGVMGKAGVNMSTVDAAVDAAQRLIDAAHAVGAPVIFIKLETAAIRDSRPATARRARLGQPYVEEKRVCRKDTWGCDWYRLAPTADDVVLPKWRYSCFQDTELDLLLKAMGVDNLIVCGLTTECCVETAVRDGFHRDYSMFLAEDACASYDPAMHEGSVRIMSIYHALIVKADQVVQAWSQVNDIPAQRSAG